MASQEQEAQGQRQQSHPRIAILESSPPHRFITPVKKINEGHDVPRFLTSMAYRDICTFVMQLNLAMCPRKASGSDAVRTWPLDWDSKPSEPVQKLQELLGKIEAIIEEAPPDTGPRRFGNVSFRKWYELLELRIDELLQMYLPAAVFSLPSQTADASALDEIRSYLMGGFGSPQRLDYGTGHELSFLAFLGCIWKLAGFTNEPTTDGSLERSIVLAVIEPYLRVVRRLILTYTLEPAGSHGVWGLDDHSFIPYILGSSQYCPAINDDEAMPIEGSLPNSPKPGDIAKKSIVDGERQHNMYFSAVGFINDVKTGPFWEHSPILFDISGVRAGWGKINKGMIKMYNAEVLSKFPVVQHFPFGSLFSWDQDPNAMPAPTTIHTASQPQSLSGSAGGVLSSRPAPQEGTSAPWASQPPLAAVMGPTAAPWAQPIPTRGAIPPIRAPWANRGDMNEAQLPARGSAAPHAGIVPPDGPTRAPWAQ
ncbi:serine phosphatase 2A activator-1 [Coleophoma cylindrospora]|uniref:Serine/threonine-protein phosphatase 2A activator n=1 Tax=Coleophoma cylindrospora TaxID=1849047 RepID=A0A3D8RLY0_9HELO|nr:serine phosphatase 2A activator-1 [Coleophoma cylindrospora]